MGRFIITCISILAMLLSASAFGGPVREFESAFRDAYADYRAALFTTNSNDAAAAAKGYASFEKKWSAIVARWGAVPPPQYADDPSWPEVLKKVNAMLVEVGAAVRAGKLTAAHEILEHFRDEIGALHARNDVFTFSDRMNAYHAKMEQVLGDTYGGYDAAGRSRLGGDVAVLAYVADDLERHPPKDLANAGEFGALHGALRASLAAMQKALAEGDVAAIRKAVTGLKPAYSKFFLRFG